MSNSNIIILGAGVTGLAAGAVSGLPVYESAVNPGGICSSYYLKSGTEVRLPQAPDDGEAYRFELGGGHWVFGGDSAVLRFVRTLTPVKSYDRRSSVYFSRQNAYVPYPLQNHLGYLSKEIVIKVLGEMAIAPVGNPKTMADWLEGNFGKTLTDLFFGPFHELYTAGLWAQIAPQDAYKSPAAFALAVQGAFDKTPSVGYNSTFVYPMEGLNTLIQRMAERCQIAYGKKVVWLDTQHKLVDFADGSETPYETLISTLPLNNMMEMTGLQVEAQPDPYTSVLVLNIGATRGPRAPDDQWLYVPDAHSGFHRVGFYSNVDVSFLQASSRTANDRVSLYVERAYPGGGRPSAVEVQVYSQAVAQELQEWGWIKQVEVLDPTWIDVAYTWVWPHSKWKSQALSALEEQSIYQVGRYGRWVFQGIADSIRDGLMVGAAFR